MKYLNPEIFQPGDIVITTDAYPFSCITRAKTWPLTERAKKGQWQSMSLGTHASMICDRGDRIYYACEMRPHLRMTELDRYDHGRYSFLPHIVKVCRHPSFCNGSSGDSYVLREKANDFMIRMHSCGVRYGWEEILKVAGLKLPDDPERFICSVWCRKVLEHCELLLPWAAGYIVTPRALQEWVVPVEINPYK